jgi:flagellar motor switch protein FliM
MTEILSQDEIDALLTAISPGDSQSELESDMGGGGGGSGGGMGVEQRKVKIYDFKRPDKFSKDQIRTLQMMHETFARLTTTGLSAQLRTLTHVHVASVDQLTYEEFIRSIPSPTTLAVVNMDPLKGSAVLEIDPAITFTIIDRLFGGAGEQFKLNRELTDIEMSVMEGIIVRMLGNLRESWSNVIDLRPRLGNIETNPQFAQIVPPNDMVVLVTSETKVGDIEGMMNFCIPYITIEPIISKLSAQYWYSSIRKGGSSENLDILKERVDQVLIDVIAALGKADITFREVLDLKKGDIINLKKTVGSDIDVQVGARTKFKGFPGIRNKRMAVQIGEIVEEVSDEYLESIKGDEDDE